MKNVTRQSSPEERLSSDEMDALRIRLNPEQDQSWDVRAHGATTVGDLSEALGVPAESIREQLQQWRAEQAILPPKKLARSQKGLLVLAALMFVTAYGIRELKVNGDLLEVEALKKISDVKKQFKKKSIHYPLTQKLDLGSDSPPYGFPMTVVGQYTVTNVPVPRFSKPLTAEEGAPLLAKALQEAFEKARDFEEKAPKPAKPPSVPQNGFGMGEIMPGHLRVTLGNTVLDYEMHPAAPPGTNLAPNYIGDAKSVLANSLAYQEPHLQPPAGNQMMPPSGFQITFKGRRQVITGGQAFSVLPMKELVGQQVVLYLRECLKKDLLPPDFGGYGPGGVPDSKIPIPAFTKVTVAGPLNTMEFEIPTGPSDKFPTSADASRGADKVLDEIRAACEDQARRVDRGEWNR